MEHTLALSSAAYHRAAFSSIKHGKFPEVVKKMKADRKGRKETATTDAYKANMREITTAYREYLEGQTKQLLKQAEEGSGHWSHRFYALRQPPSTWRRPRLGPRSPLCAKHENR
ncbi:hypothetical protein CFAM422_010483 [Trichoderma lentiforme]|uniref:Uncharacterized protein n=1 Tax=Trichoderma lentiforme TaxID=1567552 RepID=A0A9P4X7R0_9HYPO|nr:hypothetical protein CFAM422_010483 [Trichoderma lentiforme]